MRSKQWWEWVIEIATICLVFWFFECVFTLWAKNVICSVVKCEML
jgi:hypothetical protein